MKNALIVALGLVALKKKVVSAVVLLALMVLPVTVCAPEAESATPLAEDGWAVCSEVGASGRS